jgi:hypothetical protein
MHNSHEIFKSFNSIWEGGYFEGDCLAPLARSTYGQMGFISVLHATYLRCIKPYVNSNTVVLEIGPGRGTWTKAMLQAKEIHVMDALSAEHNSFHEFVGRSQHINYHHVDDFSCNGIPDDHFDYMFSFGCLCHLPFSCVSEYAMNLYPKLKSGSNCFWMIADYAKVNYSIDNLNVTSIYRNLFPRDRKHFLINSILDALSFKQQPKKLQPDKDLEPQPMRWFNSGIQDTVKMLSDIGYTILDSDVGTCLRDPIIHFVKP